MHSPDLWRPLSDAANCCEQAGVWTTWTTPFEGLTTPFEDILKSGRVPLRGKRSGHYRADPIEHLLPKVERASIFPVLDEITLYLYPSGREIAEELAGSDVLLPSDWSVTFREVRVSWPHLVAELEAAGYSIAPDDAVGAGEPARKSRGGSTSRLFWVEARKVAMDWLADEGCPAPGDGRQAILKDHMARWLSDRGHEAGKSTIRRYVAQWIAGRRAELSAT
jgi:hypothetical protein